METELSVLRTRIHLSIADVTSLLPGRHLTRTALYKIAEAFAFQRASVSVISLQWMDDWAQRGGTHDLLKRLDAYVALGTGASEKLGLHCAADS